MIDPLHAELLDIALVAAGQAGELLLNSRPANLGVAATKSSPIDGYARMIRDGHVDSYLFPSRPLTEDSDNVFFPVLPPTWRDELAWYAGVELDQTAGIVAVIVNE